MKSAFLFKGRVEYHGFDTNKITIHVYDIINDKYHTINLSKNNSAYDLFSNSAEKRFYFTASLFISKIQYRSIKSVVPYTSDEDIANFKEEFAEYLI